MMDMNMQMCRRPTVIYAAKETAGETPVGRAFTETEIQMTGEYTKAVAFE